MRPGIGSEFVNLAWVYYEWRIATSLAPACTLLLLHWLVLYAYTTASLTVRVA